MKAQDFLKLRFSQIGFSLIYPVIYSSFSEEKDSAFQKVLIPLEMTFNKVIISQDMTYLKVVVPLSNVINEVNVIEYSNRM